MNCERFAYLFSDLRVTFVKQMAKDKLPQMWIRKKSTDAKDDIAETSRIHIQALAAMRRSLMAAAADLADAQTPTSEWKAVVDALNEATRLQVSPKESLSAVGLPGVYAFCFQSFDECVWTEDDCRDVALCIRELVCRIPGGDKERDKWLELANSLDGAIGSTVIERASTLADMLA